MITNESAGFRVPTHRADSRGYPIQLQYILRAFISWFISCNVYICLRLSRSSSERSRVKKHIRCGGRQFSGRRATANLGLRRRTQSTAPARSRAAPGTVEVAVKLQLYSYVYIYICKYRIHMCTWIYIYIHTSSAAQGGGGSFKIENL